MASSRFFRPALLFALVAGVLCLSGCIWLRLLDMKSQMEDFDRWFTVPEGLPFTLIAKKPVLEPTDPEFIFGGPPTIIEPATPERDERRIWRWMKIAMPGDPPAAGVALDLAALVQDGKVNVFSVPMRFSSLVPRTPMLELMRAFGKAKVDRSTRSAKTDVQVAGWDVPDRPALIAWFGNANLETVLRAEDRGPDGEKLKQPMRGVTWRFRLIPANEVTAPAPAGQEAKGSIATITVLIPENRLRPAQLIAGLNNLSFYLTFPEPAVPAQPQPLPAGCVGTESAVTGPAGTGPAGTRPAGK